jgi:WD40 repeat protein
MSGSPASALILQVAASGTPSSQMIRRESTISLPTGISIVPPAAVSPNGSFLAAICSDNVVYLWALPSGEFVQSLDTKADPATALRFSNDGRLLAIAGTTRTIRVWHIASWKVQQEFSGSFPVYLLAISPDNHLLAAMSDYDVQVWDLTSPKRLATLHAAFGSSNSLAFSPDSTMLASADGDTAIRVYEARSGILRSSVSDFLLESLAVDFSPDGRSLFVGGADKSVSVIDPLAGKIRETFPKQSGILRGLVASPDGKQVAAIHNLPNRFEDASIGIVLLWDIGARTVHGRFDKPGAGILGGAFANGRFLFAGSTGNEAGVWSLQ